MKITSDERKSLSGVNEKEFPKYVKGILNNALNFSQANRPHTVGSMNEFRKEFQKREEGDFNLEDWRDFYYEEKNGEEKIEEATEKTKRMFENIKQAIEKVDDQMIREYIEDLVVDKTYVGFNVQSVVLKKLEEEKGIEYRFSNASEESKGIDAFINEEPISIKPETYKQKNLQEEINVPILYYKEKESGTIEVDLSQIEEENII